MGEINMSSFLLVVILVPAFFALIALLFPSRTKRAFGIIAFTGITANLLTNIYIYGKSAVFERKWCGFGIDFSLRLYQFSGFILICAAALSFLVVTYSAVFLKGKSYSKQFFVSLLFTMTLVNGAVLANNLAVMLFFWEGILVTMFTMIMTGGKKAFRTSVKAVIIVGLSDLSMMIGIGMFGYLAKTLSMEHLRLPLTSWGIFAFIFMMIGAISKAGAMPFHTWIPDAADDAPLPFMAFLPATLEKLLGIYLLARICIDLFDFKPLSPMSYLLMSIGAVTILFAVMMALIQKDYKRLLSYHAVSQVGYMILGIGTALPIGIIGGLFHMINHAIYKCCLFLTAGSVERQAGTTDLHKLGGLGRKMPVTFVCFIVAAASISGFPLTNGFFSKELIFDGALESGKIFYIIAVIGAFFTAVSFLKLGHSAFVSKPNKETAEVKEAPAGMLAPMVILAAACLLFGAFKSKIIVHLLQPVLGTMLKANETVATGVNWVLVSISVVVLILAVLDHLYGSKKTGDGLKAADHFHYAPVLRNIYNMAEKKYFDPYHVGGYLIKGYASLALSINNGISWMYDVFIVKLIGSISIGIRKIHKESHSMYLIWAIAGIAVIALVFFISI